MVGTLLCDEYIACGYVPLIIVSVVDQRELKKTVVGKYCRLINGLEGNASIFF
jgi:hypothetical protein